MINLIAVDVYDDSPTIVTIWLTIMTKISILMLLLELQTQISGSLEYSMASIITVGDTGYIEIIKNLLNI